MKVTLTSSDALAVAWAAKEVMVQPLDDGGTGLLPSGVRDWLAALRLTGGVPFQHLVADDRMLPPESIRFFYLDRNWTDALVAGALSVSAITTSDRAQLQALYPRLRDELDAAERLVRVPGNETGVAGPADVVTGLLIRSRAVSGWPAMHVRAYRAEVPDDGPDDETSRLHLMRLERLAPSVLLALFDGVPAVVHLEEPRSGLQFGFELVEFSTDIRNFHAHSLHACSEFLLLFPEGFLLLAKFFLLLSEFFLRRPEPAGAFHGCRVANDVRLFVTLEPDEVARNLLL